MVAGDRPFYHIACGGNGRARCGRAAVIRPDYRPVLLCESSAMATGAVHGQCCIVGGGPAGMMLGFLLARAGIEVVVLEKHPDFLRDFRGDTVHPSTLEVMDELGLLEEFLKLPHQEVRQLGGQIGEDFLKLADFSHLSTKCKFIALVPQWDFLDFIADQARAYSTFKLIMEAEVVDVIAEGGHIVGAKTRTLDGDLEVRADLTIGADGRG